MSRVIAAVICILVATVLCIVFGVVGLFSRSPVVFIGPVVTMVIGLGLFASIRTTRLTVDRSARTVKHERWFVLAPCIKTTTACDLSDVGPVKAEVSCVRINKQPMADIFVRCGGKDVDLGMVHLWVSDGVCRQWQAYFDWGKVPS